MKFLSKTYSRLVETVEYQKSRRCHLAMRNYVSEGYNTEGQKTGWFFGENTMSGEKPEYTQKIRLFEFHQKRSQLLCTFLALNDVIMFLSFCENCMFRINLVQMQEFLKY